MTDHIAKLRAFLESHQLDSIAAKIKAITWSTYPEFLDNVGLLWKEAMFRFDENSSAYDYCHSEAMTLFMMSDAIGGSDLS